MVPELMFSSEQMPQLSITSLKGEVVIMLRFQLCSASYTVPYKQRTVSETPLQSTQKIWTISVYKWEVMHRATMNRHLGKSTERNRTQRRMKVSP